MSSITTGHLAKVLNTNSEQLLSGWLNGMLSRMVRRDKAIENDMAQQASRFIALLAAAVSAGQSYDTNAPAWGDVKALLSDISLTRVRQGFSPIETATFVFSLKEPVFSLL